MSIAEMREAVSGAYSSESWKKRVKGFSQQRIMALYMSFLKRGLIKNG